MTATDSQTHQHIVTNVVLSSYRGDMMSYFLESEIHSQFGILPEEAQEWIEKRIGPCPADFERIADSVSRGLIAETLTT